MEYQPMNHSFHKNLGIILKHPMIEQKKKKFFVGMTLRYVSAKWLIGYFS